MGGDRLRLGALLAQQPGGVGVHLGPGRGRDRLVDGGAQEWVGEAAVGAGGEDRGADRRVEDRRGRLAVDPRQRHQRAQVGTAAEHRRRADDVGTAAVESRGALDHPGADPLGADRRDPLGGDRLGLPVAFTELGDQRLDQQRVAAGRLVAGGLDRRRGGVADPLADDLRGRRLAQQRRPDRREGEGGAEPVQGLGLDARLVRPRRQGDHRGDAVEPLPQVTDEAQRGDVGPVRVVDREDQRTALGQSDHQPEESVQRSLGRGEVDVAGIAEAEDRRRQRHRPGEEPRSPGRVERAQQRPEELADDAETEVPLHLRAGRLQHPVAARRGAVVQLPQQGRLADPRWALDQDQAAVAARLGLIQGAVERGQLALALEQPAVRGG